MISLFLKVNKLFFLCFVQLIFLGFLSMSLLQGHSYFLRSVSQQHTMSQHPGTGTRVSQLVLNDNDTQPLISISTPDIACSSTNSHNTSSSPTIDMSTPHSSSETQLLVDVPSPTSVQQPAAVQAAPTVPATAPILLQQFPTPLKFSGFDVRLWFERFNARYYRLQLSDAELYYELLNSLEDAHLQRVSHLLRNKPPSFVILKDALIKVYDIPPAQRQLSLKRISGLGDQRPSDLLNQLRTTLGIDDSIDSTAKFLLLNEFLERMPSQTRRILRLFQDQSLDFIAEKADALLQERDDDCGPFSSDAFSQLKNELSELKHCLLPSTSSQPQGVYSQTRPSIQHPLPRFSGSYPQQSRQLASSTFQSSRSRNSGRTRFASPTLRQSTASASDRSAIVNGLCYYHLNYPSNPHYCLPGCQFYNPLNSRGGASTTHNPALPSTH